MILHITLFQNNSTLGHKNNHLIIHTSCNQKWFFLFVLEIDISTHLQICIICHMLFRIENCAQCTPKTSPNLFSCNSVYLLIFSALFNSLFILYLAMYSDIIDVLCLFDSILYSNWWKLLWWKTANVAKQSWLNSLVDSLI